MKTFTKVNKDLGLKETSDWGIINSDENRVEEFILYYFENSVEKSTEMEFINLVFSSMNEALISKKNTIDIDRLFYKFISKIEKNEINLMIINLWASYKSTDTDPFPVTELINKAMVYKK
ncbi:hypothetical protein ACQY1Q_17215 [Tenacibaculum sp. TC6]|uniref:hypothetical protein n=1 Tax=Tenacibaculum sp. TC6 TaxID=3423223 RepID=UPI003D35C5CB